MADVNKMEIPTFKQEILPYVNTFSNRGDVTKAMSTSAWIDSATQVAVAKLRSIETIHLTQA